MLPTMLCACAMDVEHPDTRPLRAGEARTLARDAGCTAGGVVIPPDIGGGHGGQGGYECILDGRWRVKIVSEMMSSNAVSETAAALNSRRASGTQCDDGTLSNPGVVAGPDWIAFVSDHEGAAVVAARLDGEFIPNTVVGPPDGVVNCVCPTPNELAHGLPNGAPIDPP